MDFEVTDEQRELCAAVRGALAQESPVAVAREVVETGRLSQQPWRVARELGWQALTVPEDCGGLGLGAVELLLVCEELGGVLATGPLLPTLTQFVPVVRAAGSPEQRARFLAPVAAGEKSGTLACSNRAGAFRRPDGEITARRDGDGWRVQGTRHWVVEADSADEVVFAAQVESGDGVGLFALPSDEIECRRVGVLDPSRPLCELRVDAHVEPGRALGTPGSCAPALDRALEEATAALAMETVGASQALFDLTRSYASEREQFGQPIGSFQAIQHKLADLFIEIEKARSTGYFAAVTLAEEDERLALAASMAKVAAGDCQRLLAREAVQIHGGIGFTWEADVHLFVRRIQTSERLLGTSGEHRARIAALLEV